MIVSPQVLGLLIGLGVVVFILLPSIRIIGAVEIGLVMKRISARKLSQDSPVALKGEAGYQSELLMPGFRFKLWLLYRVTKFPWVQVPAGEIGVVISQVGDPLPIGAKSARYKPEFENFSDLRTFLTQGGQKGVQRPVLPPGSLLPIHPVAFLVITKRQVYGVPVSPELQAGADRRGMLTPEVLGLRPDQLELVRISAHSDHDHEVADMVGIVTTYEGDPLSSGDIASRLGGFSDLLEVEGRNPTDAEQIERLLGSKNVLHNNYQDYQAFLDNGGKIGLQHDPLLYGAYALNPFLVSVELFPMLVVKQGQVAVIKAYVGLATADTSGDEFKFGALVRPGHRGIWREPLRTGKYPINPHVYQAEIVPTAILTLNWAEASSEAHNLDRQLRQIIAKSREGFVFSIDLQVQIHVPDTQAPRVISMVGTMQNLVNEVLQAAVGNHFRNKLQSMSAVEFIETRQEVQQQAFEYIRSEINRYDVETRGVYIQDVIFPQDLVVVLTQREIANQEVQTFQKQREAQDQRVTMEASKGTADMQAQLAQSKVGVDIQTNRALARKAEADGEATYIRETGRSRGAQVEAIGLARAKAYREQVAALGQSQTAIVNAIAALAESNARFMPEILVAGGGGQSSLDGLAATLMGYLKRPPAAAALQESAVAPAEPGPPAGGVAGPEEGAQ